MSDSTEINYAKKAAENYSYKIKLSLPKKITPEIARQEIERSHLLGQAESAERIIVALKQLKTDSYSLDEFEGELHLYLTGLLNNITEKEYKLKMFSPDMVIKNHTEN